MILRIWTFEVFAIIQGVNPYLRESKISTQKCIHIFNKCKICSNRWGFGVLGGHAQTEANSVEVADTWRANGTLSRGGLPAEGRV